MLLPTQELGELVIFSFYITHIRKKLHFGPWAPVSEILNIFSPVTIAEVYSTTSQSFMLLPTREIGGLVIFKCLYSQWKGKKRFWAPGPHEAEFINSFSPFVVERGYLITSQGFMLLHTREVRELVMSQF